MTHSKTSVKNARRDWLKGMSKGITSLLAFPVAGYVGIPVVSAMEKVQTIDPIEPIENTLSFPEKKIRWRPYDNPNSIARMIRRAGEEIN
jgi:hypothetical protein